MKPPPLFRSFLLALLAAPISSAGTIVADFNDNTPGALSNGIPGTGQAGGSGFASDPNNTWGNTGTIDAIADDLVAPATTNYSRTQSVGTALSARGSWAEGRQMTRALAEPLGGTIWFSFLINQPSAESRGGITFNQDAYQITEPRIVAAGTALRIGLTSLNDTGPPIAIGQTSLVLGRLSINPMGDEVLDVWVDPDVSGGVAGLPAPDDSLTENVPGLDAGVTRIGVQSYGSSNLGGIVDALVLSDSGNAFEVVTSDAAAIADDPNLAVALANPFGGVPVPPQPESFGVELSLENSGATQALTISDTTSIGGADPDRFAILSTLPIILNPGGTEPLEVAFAPSGSAGTFTAQLSLQSNDPSNPSIAIPLEVTVPPILDIDTANPFAGFTFNPNPDPTTATVAVSNTSATTTVNILDTTGVTGFGSANFALLTAVPISIPPGGSADLEIRFDAGGSAGPFGATLEIRSDDPGNEQVNIGLMTNVPEAGELLGNGDFETGGGSLADWDLGGTASATTAGIAPGSTTGAAVAASGWIEQTGLGGAADWFAEFFFQSSDTQNRAFNVLVVAPGGQINLRYQGDIAQWNAYQGSWGDALGLGAITPGEIYRMRIVGHGWGGPSPTYDLFLSGPGGTSLTEAVEGLSRYQNGTVSGPPTSIRFTNQYGDGPGFTVDDVQFVNGTPPPDVTIAVTQILYDPGSDQFTLTWRSDPSRVYGIYYSPDAIDWGGDIDDSIFAADGETETSFGPFANPLTTDPGGPEEVRPPAILFRVQDQGPKP